MKSKPLFRYLIVLAFGWGTSGPLRAGITLTPLWTIDPAAGLPVASTANNERSIAYNPVSGNVLICTRSTADIYVLDAETGAILQEPEIDHEGQPTGLTVNRKLLKRPFSVPPDLPPADVITSQGTSGALNLVGVADDGVVYACNLVIASQTARFRLYRWEKDDISTVEENFGPYIAWPPQPTEEDPSPTGNGNPDVSLATTLRWGDSMTVRGAGINTQILVGADTGAVALFTTTNGVDFTPAFFPGVLTGAGRGLGFGAGDTFYSKSSGGTTLRRSGFTLTPPAVSTLNNYALPAPASASTNPLAVDVAAKRLAMIDLTTGGTDEDVLRLYDISNTAAAPVVVKSIPLDFTYPNANQTGALALGESKVFVCSTNKGIQAFSIVDDNQAVLPTAVVTPAAPAVWTRGVLTLTGAVTGTPAPTFQWYKDNAPIAGETGARLFISPVTPATAGAYKLVATNAAGAADSNVVNVTTPASLDTGVLTKLWQLSPGSLPWLTTLDAERGMDVNPERGHMYVVSRSPALTVQVLDTADGTGVGTLNLSGVAGGLSGIALNMIGVAGDGAIYACNLADDLNPLNIYRWSDDDPGTLPLLVYTGHPVSGRIGDCMDVRGSGDDTEIVIGARASNYVVFKYAGGGLTPLPVTVPDVPAGTFNLGIAFGTGHEVWGKTIGTHGTSPNIQPLPLVRTAYNPETGAGTLLAATPAASVLNPSIGLAFDPASQLVAIIGSELSDGVRLYRLTNPATGALQLLDHEFFATDNVNANGVGSVTFAGGRLYALNTNNGIAAFSVTLPSAPVLTDLARSGSVFSFTLNGAAGGTYLIQRSADMEEWADDGTVTISTGTSIPVTRNVGEGKYFFRAKAQ